MSSDRMALAGKIADRVVGFRRSDFDPGASPCIALPAADWIEILAALRESSAGEMRDDPGRVPPGPGSCCSGDAASASPPAEDGDLAGRVSADSYQVIAALADAAGRFDDPEVIRALDYFGYDQWREPGREILPFGLTSSAPTAGPSSSLRDSDPSREEPEL